MGRVVAAFFSVLEAFQGHPLAQVRAMDDPVADVLPNWVDGVGCLDRKISCAPKSSLIRNLKFGRSENRPPSKGIRGSVEQPPTNSHPPSACRRASTKTVGAGTFCG